MKCEVVPTNVQRFGALLQIATGCWTGKFCLGIAVSFGFFLLDVP